MQLFQALQHYIVHKYVYLQFPPKLRAAVLSWSCFEAEMDVMEEMGRLVQLVPRDLKEREEIPEDHRDLED